MDKNSSKKSCLEQILSTTVFFKSISGVRLLLEELSQLFSNVLNADSGSLWLKCGLELHCALVFSRSLYSLNNTVIKKHEGLAGTVLKNRQSLLLNNMINDDRALFKDLIKNEGYSCYLGSPIIVQGEIIGVLSYYLKKEKLFLDKDVNTIEFACKMLSLAIEHCSVAPNAQNDWLELFQRFASINFSPNINNNNSIKSKAYSVWLLVDNLPKGIHPITLNHIRMEMSPAFTDTKSIAQSLGISLSSIRRYLNYLYDHDIIEREIVYTLVGHPSYRLANKILNFVNRRNVNLLGRIIY